MMITDKLKIRIDGTLKWSRYCSVHRKRRGEMDRGYKKEGIFDSL